MDHNNSDYMALGQGLRTLCQSEFLLNPSRENEGLEENKMNPAGQHLDEQMVLQQGFTFYDFVTLRIEDC